MKLRRIPQKHNIALTPMLDVMTNLLIFLIVIQSHEEAEIEKAKSKVTLPEATAPLTKLPPLRLEIEETKVSINGEAVSGLSIADAASWNTLGDKLASPPQSQDTAPHGIVVLSDKKVPYQLIDRAAAQIARAGIAEVYFLSERKETKKEKP